MSVLVNMEMPQYCGACQVGFCKQIGCDKYIGFDNYATSRHPDCPLVKVPPHGDLIDMDSEIDVYDRYDDDIIRPSTVRGLINDFISGGYPRTIIKAEK